MLLLQLLAKDVTGKGPLHYAGAYGHKVRS